MKTKLLLAALLFAPVSPALAQIVVAPAGTIQGTTVGTAAGTVEKFLGIPYAQPPVRWQRSVAMPPSVTTIDATLPKAACAQILNTTTAGDCRDNPGQTSGLVGGEDCLTLSIWRPAAAAATPRRVMVWIHGGALVTGCAKDGLTEASDLALQGTPGGDGEIVVALQYRLGPMGFFALPELRSEDPNHSVGNYGMLDQVLALQWVQENIAAFGGDPNNVTILGESAGGFSTYMLEASPLTPGLFNRAISESGGYGQAIPLEPGVGAPSGTFGPTATAFPRGIALASHATLNCLDPPSRVGCMRAKPIADIFSAWGSSGGGGVIGGGGASPAIDGYFLTEQASQMIQDSLTPPRPLMTGANANEMTFFTLTTNVPSFPAYENLIRAQFGTTAGNIILGVYPSAAFTTPLEAYRRVLEDILFVCPTFTQGKLIHDKGGEAHVYHFAYPVTALLGLNAFHGSELFYVFGNLSRLTGVGVTADAGDIALSDAMQTAWTSFAANGAPIATPAWGAFDPGPGGPASAGGVLTWNLTPGDALDNTFTPSGSLRDGRCAQLAALASTLNGDFDSFTNDRDDCPFATNSDQADSGSVAGGPADGIGDKCQCGDASDDGVVDSLDVSALRNTLASGGPLSPGGVAKCRVESASTACDIVDVAVLRRRLATPQQLPGISQSCAAANPA